MEERDEAPEPRTESRRTPGPRRPPRSVGPLLLRFLRDPSGGFSGALAFLGLYLFVAIPLPGTGAWTGSLVAAVFGMKKWRALFAVFLGVLTAGVIMTLASYGVVSAFKIFAK